MRAVFVLHLFYPDVAIELIEQVARLSSRLDVIVTTPSPLPPPVRAALDRLPNHVDVVLTENRGWDIGPLFAVLPLIAERGYEVICKLHTKKGGSGYIAEWRALFHEALTGSDTLVDRILDAFEAHPELDLVGPAALYKSAASHMFRNGGRLSELLPQVMAPALPPSDWGFFAGTMFWARRRVLERLQPYAVFEAGGEPPNDDRDGSLAHAMERLFGLAPVAHGGSIGLVTPDASGEAGIEIVSAPGSPSHEPIVRTLVAKAEQSAGAIEPELADAIRRANPLIDYIHRGRDLEALDPNPYFSSNWYNRVNADVYAAGMHPLIHYVHHGAFEDRSTSPLFDMGYYLATNPEVAASGLDPLRHFLEHGLPAGRSAIPVSQPGGDDSGMRPRRFYRTFDLERERTFLNGLTALPATAQERAREVRFSVVMPTYNRRETVADAIRSVLAQTHGGFELIIVDDGSTDGSDAVIALFLADPRVKLIHGRHGGVSAARNVGLDHASGEIVAYLDSDNRWKPWFLQVMALFMTHEGLDAAYCAIEARDDLGQLSGYRGDEFDWTACLEQNYVDLNGFCHRRALVADLGGFDPDLRRMVDWDLILRYGRDRAVGYAPFVGCEYFDGKADAQRITVREPLAFQKVVQAKHRHRLPAGPQGQALAKHVGLTFAIKIAAPEEEKANWGDFHFAESLKEAIERLGHTAHIDFRNRWNVRPVSQEDVAIVLRGLIPYDPQPGQICFLWNISHPDQVDYEEYERFSRVYVASHSYAELLRQLITVPVDAMLQATDTTRFHPHDDPQSAPDIVFCGNSRGVDRDIVRWAIKAERPPAIYGGGWEGLVAPELVVAPNIDNRALGDLYAGAGVVLNDHWPSMRAFGLLSNRLFDVVASGGRAVSDPVPSMASVFGNAVAQVSGPIELGRTVDRLLADRGDEPARREAAALIHAEHSFDARARRIVTDAFAMLGLPAPGISPQTAPKQADSRLRVHVIAPFGRFGPQSSAYIRLVAPLTDDTVARRVRLSLGGADDPLPDCDICIVQRTALRSTAAVDALLRSLGERSAVLVTDIDDAFSRIGPDHPEEAVYRPLNAALERAIAASAETWFATAEVRAAYAGHAARSAIVPNMLDPRIWRDWRRPRPPILRGGKVRMLYMGTHTHGADFALIRPALDRLAAEQPDTFEVTIVGIAPDLAPAPWLGRLSPPAGAIAYPRFVRWLRAQEPFDVGLAPLVDSPFNRAKSDIKLLDYAALGMLPVVSDTPPYQPDREAAALSVQVGASSEQWVAALRDIIDNPADYAARAGKLQEHVWRKRSVAAQAEALVDRLAGLKQDGATSAPR
jgi:hypothetical protein